MSERLFAAYTRTAAMNGVVSDAAWVRAMLDVEAALAAACGEVGAIPAEHAAAVERTCRALDVEVEALAQGVVDAATPVIALVAAIRAAAPGDAAGFVHWGASTPDVLDSALALVLRAGARLIADDVALAADRCAALAVAHRHSVMPGRTLLQHAAPTTFGRKAAGWLAAFTAVEDQLRRAADERLTAHLGGAVGTLASLGPDGPAVAGAFARRLGFGAPASPWHTARTGAVEVETAVGAAAGAADKVALDILLLAQTEVGEVAEGGDHGRSSALPQKRNPVGSVAVRAAARRAGWLAAGMLASTAHEHERAAGAWQAECAAVSDLLHAAHAAVSRIGAVLDGLHVDAPRMALNLSLAGGTVMAEAVVAALAPGLGRPEAADVVAEACRRADVERRSLRDVLHDTESVVAVLGVEGIDAALDPTRYLGAADAHIDAALDEHRRRRT